MLEMPRHVRWQYVAQEEAAPLNDRDIIGY